MLCKKAWYGSARKDGVTRVIQGTKTEKDHDVLITHVRLHRKRKRRSDDARKKFKHDVIGLTETRQRHPLNAVYKTREELSLGTCDSTGVGGIGVNTSMTKNIDSFEQLTIRIGRLRMRRCGPTPALTIFVAYAPTSSYQEEEVEAFCMDLEKFYREDYAFYKVIIGDFNAKIGPRRTDEEMTLGPTAQNEMNFRVQRTFECTMTTKTIHGSSHFQKPSPLRWT
ncbi:hypothetical protein NECAME_16373 [Necator americanus]|uniref:Endonuclease/exonuclease/phosphatase domain-containing protein n=1 Tax=Necator americanus TaxID=51031 RepID=W2TZA9_NECAM|nr:hypothetical protein NECAME_16373 [Necator americanus]ETN86396.1 hypothetical protein NECAME_16373 [Necator americanus]